MERGVMLAQLLEAALRSLVLGGAVWLSLKCLRVQNPQVRMTAWTVVLAVSLSMPLLMHWATVTIPTYLPSPDTTFAAAATPSTSLPTGFAAEKMSLPSAEKD